MPKKADDRLYLNPAVPRDSRLAEYLEESSARSGITKSQLLVWFAAEYVRLVVDGAGVVSAAPVLPASIPSEAKAEQTQGNVRTLSMATGDDANYDSVFGDPD
jgi:hypothetical protein